MVYDPRIHKRKTIRLNGFDYTTAGIYFITICTQNRECIFGNVENGIFIPNQVGIMIEQHWRKIEQEFKNIKLDEYVIMPNHLHGIICIVDLVSAQNPNDGQCFKGTYAGMRADTRPAPTTIGDMICAFKSKTTNCYIQNVKQNNWKPFDRRIWQRNYFEHIIRNGDELNKIRNYIINNPLKWDFDSNNSIKESR